MSFIGILTEYKNEEYLKEQIAEKDLGEAFFLNEKTIDNMRNIKFETFLLGKKIEDNQQCVRSIAENASYVVLNSDVKENLAILDNLDLTLITYGYNQKATITTSSIEENKKLVCLQRNIKNVYGEEVEPQEIEVNEKKEANNYAIMEFVGLNLIYNRQNK